MGIGKRRLGVLLAGALAASLLAWVPIAGGHLSPASSPQALASALPFQTGIADQETEMFTNPLWEQLHTSITRYVVPYDAIKHQWDMMLSHEFIEAAEKAHQRILIAFYHSEYEPTKIPSTAEYTEDVAAYVKEFPNVHEYQPWNEANRGNEIPRFESPTAVEAAQYYQALEGVCDACTIVGLDVLDQQHDKPTLQYIKEFKSELGQLKMPMPKLWGLHNYSDTNRFQNFRTRQIVAAMPGEVWVTETGGIVKFGAAFPNKHGAGLTRAAKALKWTFKIAKEHKQIKRLYIYQWTGATPSEIFDAGLTNDKWEPRPGYVVVCKELHAARCNVKTVDN